MNQLQLPKTSWAVLIDALLQLRLNNASGLDQEDRLFLTQLGYADEAGELTELGREVCLLEFVTKDETTTNQIHHDAIIALPVTQLILQSLWGAKDIGVGQVRNALLIGGADAGQLSKRLTILLQILNRHSVITYDRKHRQVTLLVKPLNTAKDRVPPHVYIDRARPFSNDFLIREIIGEARGSVMWLDKYFQKEAFEWLWREADAAKISEVKIVSLQGDSPFDKHTLGDFKRLKLELAARGISIDWRTLPRSQTHDFHDRWILDDHDLCYNLPSIGSIKSGQRSELHKSPNHDTIRSIFDGYYNAATSVLT